MAAATYIGLTYMIEATLSDPDTEQDRFLFRKVDADALTNPTSVAKIIEEHCNWKATSVVRHGELSGAVHHGPDIIILYKIVSVLEIDGNYFKLSPIVEE